MVDMYYEQQMRKFINANYENPEQILNAINNDNKVELSELVKAPITSQVKKEYKKKQERSKSAQDLMNHFKAT